MLMSLIYNGFFPTVSALSALPTPIFLSASTISNKKSPVLRLSFFAVRTRFELATSGVTGRHSNQLNYRTNWKGLQR